MDAIAVFGLGLGLLAGFGWLAARAGVDSRPGPRSEEERLASWGYSWSDRSPSLSHGFADHATLRLGDLHREAHAHRLALAARRRHPGGQAGPVRAARARLATGLARLAARVDCAAALEATRATRHPSASRLRANLSR